MELPFFQSKTGAIFLSGLTTGTLDILCAIFILAAGNAAGVFRFIAKGAFDDAALQGGPEMIILGAVFHYIIAFSFAAGYFFFFPYIPFIKKQPIISGLFYSIFVWAFMQFLVLPLTHNPPAPFSFSGEWKGILIVMVAVGLPVSLVTHKHYSVRPFAD